MKFLKYIKEYFDTEELKRFKHIDKKDIKELTKDENIDKMGTMFERIANSIVANIAGFEKFECYIKNNLIVFKFKFKYTLENDNDFFIADMVMRIMPENENTEGLSDINNIQYAINFIGKVYFNSEENDVTYLFDNQVNRYVRNLKELIEVIRKEVLPEIKNVETNFKKYSNIDLDMDLNFIAKDSGYKMN